MSIEIHLRGVLFGLKTVSYSLFLLIPQLWILGFILNQVFGIQTLKPYFTLNLPLISWFTLLASGFISTTLPINFLYSGLSKVKPNIASLLLVTELAWVSILGFILFGQTLTGWGILGIIGITLAVLLV